MNPTDNPFAVLTLIAAPAVLTNASTVLVMSTSNRLARTLDRARFLTQHLDQGRDELETDAMHLRELRTAQSRVVLLVRALQAFYTALGGFASAAMVSLLGAILVTYTSGMALRVTEILAVVVGFAGVGNLVFGSVLLIRETRIALTSLREQSDYVREKVEHRLEARA
ncbi:DUF2721 domain-containing protein [bacterium]|nr:MAG: DUF2721 domain-containing protein [bacterium]